MAKKAIVGEKLVMTQVWDDDKNVVPVTEPAQDAPAEGGEKGPSKGALKKAAKEKEKVRLLRPKTML